MTYLKGWIPDSGSVVLDLIRDRHRLCSNDVGTNSVIPRLDRGIQCFRIGYLIYADVY